MSKDLTRRIVIGVMGGAKVKAEDIGLAYQVGRLIAQKGWVLLNGGRPAGIMEASAKGAKEQGGLTVGILPGTTLSGASVYVDIPILTGIGDARNYINILSSQVIIACSGGPGTISEIALALKNERPVVLLNFNPGTIFDIYKKRGLLCSASSAEEAITKVEFYLHADSLNRRIFPLDSIR